MGLSLDNHIISLASTKKGNFAQDYTNNSKNRSNSIIHQTFSTILADQDSDMHRQHTVEQPTKIHQAMQSCTERPPTTTYTG